jgi:ABC-type oligopeptide transport system ATPase subunit
MSAPVSTGQSTGRNTGQLLDIENVSRSFWTGGLLSRRRVDAVRDVSFALTADRPEIFTIIGESGSGKSTLARMILNSMAPTSGCIRFRGEDLSSITRTRDRMHFMCQVQPIFQNPFESFNPLKQVDRYLTMTARNFTEARSQAETDAASDRALRKVGLSLAEVKGRFPHELSGGQLQRIAIARALIPGPSVIVADEPVSMVDASLRVAIVNLFKDLRDELKVSIIYITHDLATAYYISDRIIIMQKGEVVESGDARAVLSNPQHPYSILLKNSVLSPDVPEDTPPEIQGPEEGMEPSPVGEDRVIRGAGGRSF